MKLYFGNGMLKVDVVLLTKNSLKPCLKECVEPISEMQLLNYVWMLKGWLLL